MSKIFCIMGKSSSGKDTIYKKLLEKKVLELNKIVSYTTRPIRVGEQEGVEYHFSTEEELHRLQAEGKVIECRAYHTFYGIWYYYTVADEQIQLDSKDYLIIGTVESFEATRKYFGKDVVIPIMIELDDGIRLQRALNRELKQEHPKYEEMCRRFLADQEDFAPEKIAAAEIRGSFINENLEKCIAEIESYIVKMKTNR